MADSFHFNISIISRGKGKSAVASAAYISGEKIKNEWDGELHDYTHKDKILHTDILLPKGIPKEFMDRSFLWNSVELNEKASNAQLARQFIIALPKELSLEENKKLMEEFIQTNFVNEGMIVDYAIHDQNKEQNGNIHAHILTTMRPINEQGIWQPKSKKEYLLDEQGNKILGKNGKPKTRKIDLTTWNEKGNAEKWREHFSTLCNQYLEKAGEQKRVDHRSYKRQNSDYLPTIHLGASASAMERKGIQTDKGNYNREIKQHNHLVKIMKEQLHNLTDWIKDYLKDLTDQFKIFSRESRKEMESEPKLFNLREYIEVYKMIQDENQKLLGGYAKQNKARYDFKKFADAHFYLSTNQLNTLADLSEHIKELKSKSYKLNGQAKENYAKMENLDKKLLYYDLIQKNKSIYQTYQSKVFFKEKYRNDHLDEIEQYENAKKQLTRLIGEHKKAEPKKWKAEKKELSRELALINAEKESITKAYQSVNHIKYATKIVNEELGIDLSVVIDEMIREGEKPSTISQIKAFQEQIKREDEMRKDKKIFRNHREGER